MEFLRKNFRLSNFIQRRPYSFGIFGQYQQSLRDTWPKFPFPNPRHQAVQSRPAPVLPDVDATQPGKQSLTESVLQSVMLCPAAVIRKAANSEPTECTSSPHVKSPQRVPEISPKRVRYTKPLEPAVRVMLKQLQFQRQQQLLREQLSKEQAERSASNRKVPNQRRHTSTDKERAPHTGKLPVRQRLNHLMQLQQELDEVQGGMSGYEHEQYVLPKRSHSVVESIRTNEEHGYFQPSNRYCYIPQYQPKIPDFDDYTPTNSESDNCDVLARSMRKLTPAADSLPPPRLDQLLRPKTAQSYVKESAMSILYRNVFKQAKP